MSILIFLLISYVLLSLSLMPLFRKAGQNPTHALIPGLNFVVWNRITGQPAWWALLLLLPIVNFFIFAGMAVDLVRSFGYYKFRHSALAVIYAPVIFFIIGRDDKAQYLGQIVPMERDFKRQLREARKRKDAAGMQKLSRSPLYKPGWRDTVESIVFAVFAAAFIRMFLIEAYMIPTPSMEGSLLVGDHLFVSKMHYGIRMPMTVLQIPLLYNRIPFVNRESYLKEPHLDYRRLPALQSVERYDPVVFNYPDGDSVYLKPERSYSYHDAQRAGDQSFARTGIPLTTRPIDKKDHYIKRCIGLPGDTLQIRDRQVYINGQKAEDPSEVQFLYQIQSGAPLNLAKLQEWGIDINEMSSSRNLFALTNSQVEKVKSLGPDVQVEIITVGPNSQNPNYYFPHDSVNFKDWSPDNFGPLYIPKAGATVSLSPQSIAPYRRIISVFEGHDLQEKDGKIYIDGKEADSYTFAQNYYWMMGDNRHNSEDSRVWGYVPEDHIVGKPLFIWLSTKNGSLRNGIRWDRMFTTANRR